MLLLFWFTLLLDDNNICDDFGLSLISFCSSSYYYYSKTSSYYCYCYYEFESSAYYFYFPTIFMLLWSIPFIPTYSYFSKTFIKEVWEVFIAAVCNNVFADLGCFDGSNPLWLEAFTNNYNFYYYSYYYSLNSIGLYLFNLFSKLYLLLCPNIFSL